MSGETEGSIGVTRKAGVAWIVIDNPDRMNAMSLGMWEALDEALSELAADPDVRCIAIGGARGKAFCTGHDLSDFGGGSGADAIETTIEFDAYTREVMARMRAVPKPTVAVIEGYCLGAGLAIALCCDLRIGRAGSSYGIPAAKLGVGYDAATLERLALIAGPARAKSIMFTAGRMAAVQAQQRGLVDEVYEDENFAADVDAYVEGIAGLAPLTIAAAKAAIDLAGREAAVTEREAAQNLATACYRSEDFAEGRRAFSEKRKPKFRGR